MPTPLGGLARPLFVAALAAALSAPPLVLSGLAAQTPRPAGSGQGRTVGAHLFLPSSAFPDPFVASYARSLIGAGAATGLTVPVYNASDSIVRTLEGDISFLQIDVEYQQRVIAWLGLRVNVSGLARSGTETSTLLSEGLAAVYNVGFGATARIWGNDKFLLSGSLDTRSNQLFGMTPLEYVQSVTQAIRSALDSVLGGGGTIDSTVIDAIIDSLDLDAYSLFRDDHTESTTGGLRVAYAPAPWLGLSGLAQTGVAGVFDGASDLGLVDLGAAASVDFLPLWRVPIGVHLSGRWQSVSDRGSDLASSTTAVAVGITYTGRSDFAIGLEVVFANLEQRQSVENAVGKRAGLAMRYYF